MKDEFAENLLRGVTDEKKIKGNSVDWTAFIPSGGNNNNGWGKSSINWEDDENAIDHLQSQKKNGEIQFKGGIVRIPRTGVDEIISHFHAVSQFAYEREELEDNPYHGNLLFSTNITKELRNTICGSLSFIARLLH